MLIPSDCLLMVRGWGYCVDSYLRDVLRFPLQIYRNLCICKILMWDQKGML